MKAFAAHQGTTEGELVARALCLSQGGRQQLAEEESVSEPVR